MSWIVWLVLAAVAGGAELLTVTLTLGLIAVAAAVAAVVVGGLGAPVPFQILAFVVAAGAGLVLVRPIAVRHLKQAPSLGSSPSSICASRWSPSAERRSLPRTTWSSSSTRCCSSR